MSNRHWFIAVLAAVIIGGWLANDIFETLSEGPEVDPIAHYVGFMQAINVNDDRTAEEVLDFGYYICNEYPNYSVDEWDDLTHYQLVVNATMFGINQDDADRMVRMTHINLCP